MRASSSKNRATMVMITSIVTGLTVWGLLSTYVVDPVLLPHPFTVWSTAVEMSESGLLWESIGASIGRVTWGWVMGVVAGIVTGLLLGGSRVADAIAGPIFEFLKGVAPISLVPIMILWFGIGDLPKLLIIAYITWVVVTVSTATGVREVPRVRMRSARCLGLSQVEIFYRIILPSTASYVLVGMRSGIGFAYIALVSAEFIAVDKGVGYLIMDSRMNLLTGIMVVGIITLGLLGSGSQFLFDEITLRIPWLSRFRRQ
jgi:ABC-type nitrate/sulfonate/bicarbonate transport system permease component